LNNHRYTLFSGSTGLLGSYLLRDLLLENLPLAVIVRPGRKQSADERVAALVADWEKVVGRELPRPVVFAGDLTQPDCGLNADARRWISENCDQVLNNAASLSFRNADREGEPWRTNVNGTRSLIDLARTVGIRHMHHVSTAYVCGIRSGRVLENELEVGQEFGNDYELSKVEAENMVRQADCFDTTTIYRPSIIVGDSQTGYTSTYHGFFAALRIGHTLLTRVAIGATSGRALLKLLGIDPDASKNFVPVDWVAAVIARGVQSLEARGSTFHVTHPNPLPMSFVAEVVQEAVESYSIAATPDDPDLCDEEWFAENMRTQLDVYQRYFRNDPVFDTTQMRSIAGDIPCPTLDEDSLMRMSKFAISHDFGKYPPSLIPAQAEGTEPAESTEPASSAAGSGSA
jgi:thioester reductase-like protein